LLKSKCWACHGDDPKGELKGKLDLKTRASMLKGGESGESALVPGKPDESLLFQAINWDGYEMPPKENDRLTKTEIDDFREWIRSGAPWPEEERLVKIQSELRETAAGVAVVTSGGQSEDWTQRRYDPVDLWAYQPISQPAVPELSTNPVDAFIDVRLKQANLIRAAKADKLTLIRRATFDLTGLPATPAEVRDFLKDESPNAFENVVDRLLASPHYGEQMARHWLDVVRYADTAGFSNDFERPNAWRYRDYVIRSFNRDKPFDQFIYEQLAGDEILEERDRQNGAASKSFDLTPFENSSPSELLVAAGYLRMGPWEHTGMSVMALTRQQFLDDVVNSVGEAFLGTTLRCCKCHDHKFDPMPTLDYYRMQAIFAPVQFAERDAPFQDFESTAGLEEQKSRILKLIEDPGVELHIHENATEREIEDAMKGVTKVINKQTSIRQRQQYRYEPLAFSVYNGPIDEKYRSNNARHPMPGPKQRTGEVQQVALLRGGALETPGDIVTPGVLSAIPGSNDLSNKTEWNSIPNDLHGRRLALARWIASPENPLTSRVIVNRIWQWHFGTGIAGNPNNFGKTGKKPSHPELLDWLAADFLGHGWTLKRMHRQIMLSETYQQSGQPADPELSAKADPANKLLSWFPPRRLSAEEIRDSMLAVSGELNPEMFGVPIRPAINREVAFQPRHVMGSVAPAYQPSRTPAERNRRTIYALKVRTLRDPMLEVFDQPNADNSCERRDSSTVTPQVFGLFNAQNSYDRALAMATRLSEETGQPEKRGQKAFELAYGRQPAAEELAACLAHVRHLTAHHREHPAERQQFPPYIVREMVEEMTGITFQWREQLDVYQQYVPDRQAADASPEIRAWADLCLVLMNSNEFLYVY
ncbi:MAG TPA: PSD1 and planctomycete cytochrome C domain-containing protein, partial [Planctomycetaceae bacterium]|nr:PSD1 and planctomycete cytochrome C domain-containing protein [Planctomycetaceae bacterium]